MDREWDAFEAALESSDPDRINAAIDEIEALDIDERAELFDAWFDDLTTVYKASDDGYVRQSVVRVAERLTPGIVAAYRLQSDDALPDELERLPDRTDALCGFMLEALTDEDGRVRQSAKRGIRDVFRTYDALKDTETIEALAAELDEMAAEYSGSHREHLLEASEDARFHTQSEFGKLIGGVEQALRENEDRDA